MDVHWVQAKDDGEGFWEATASIAETVAGTNTATLMHRAEKRTKALRLIGLSEPTTELFHAQFRTASMRRIWQSYPNRNRRLFDTQPRGSMDLNRKTENLAIAAAFEQKYLCFLSKSQSKPGGQLPNLRNRKNCAPNFRRACAKARVTWYERKKTFIRFCDY